MRRALVLGMSSLSAPSTPADKHARTCIDRAYRAMADYTVGADQTELYMAASCLHGQLDHLASLSPSMQAGVRYTLNTINTYIKDFTS